MAESEIEGKEITTCNGLSLKSWEVHISGIVQGVGFRPYVSLYAHHVGWTGHVSNEGGQAKLVVNTLEKDFKKQLADLISNVPDAARVTDVVVKEIDHQEWTSFSIVESDPSDADRMVISPERAVCTSCVEESLDETNRRYLYGYTACTDCGPRYSVINNLPYDRALTEMHLFEMCSTCREEYETMTDRRYHSQSNSCPECGVTHRLLDDQHKEVSNDQIKALDEVVKAWNDGKAVAIKGLGGYLLTADASSSEAVTRVRSQKARPRKPLAIMVPDTTWLTIDTPQYILDELTSAIAPIVLVRKKYLVQKTWPEELTYGLDRIGVMLPNTTLLNILLKRYGNPIVATSANISSSPIIYRDKDVGRIKADYFLMNNRAITTPQDDSVVSFSTRYGHKVIHRRSRGLAPNVFNIKQQHEESILCMGADLKSTVTLAKNGEVCTSQYIGNLSSYDTQVQKREITNHLLQVTATRPERVVCDAHPGYQSTMLAKSYSELLSVPLKMVQHHKAHFAAILAEHNLIETDKTILGVIWDGTGYGDDGHIWGGEFFQYRDGEMSRCCHVDYFPTMNNDKVAQEPRLAALSLAMHYGIGVEWVDSKFSEQELKIYKSQLRRSTLRTSSIGRVFDAVSSLLGVCDVQTYEGEAAMKLEQLASNYLIDNELSDHYPVVVPEGSISFKSVIHGLLKDLDQGLDKGLIAAKFHLTLAQVVKMVTRKITNEGIALSGGVFQNGLLLDLITEVINDRKVYMHKQLSPNDENISLGQAMYLAKADETKNKSKKQQYVFSNTR